VASNVQVDQIEDKPLDESEEGALHDPVRPIYYMPIGISDIA